MSKCILNTLNYFQALTRTQMSPWTLDRSSTPRGLNLGLIDPMKDPCARVTAHLGQVHRAAWLQGSYTL